MTAHLIFHFPSQLKIGAKSVCANETGIFQQGIACTVYNMCNIDKCAI